jgi:hypothetical protein
LVRSRRPVNILDAVLAHIDEADRQLLADLFSHRGADADLARFGERLQPRRYIDAVAEDVAFVVDDVAEIDADAEADAFSLRPISVAVCHSLLKDDGTAQGVNDRGELDQDAIASGLEDASAMLGDQRIDQFTPIAFEGGQGSLFVGPHQPRISGDIGAEDRGQPPLYRFLSHRTVPREEKPQ